MSTPFMEFMLKCMAGGFLIFAVVLLAVKFEEWARRAWWTHRHDS